MKRAKVQPAKVGRSTVRTRRLRNIHPGEVLVEEFLGPRGITQYHLAKSIGVPLTARPRS